MSNLKPNLATGTGANIIPPPVVHKPVAPVAVAPVAPVVPMEKLSLAEKVVHEPERVIQHEPLREKEVINESTLEVKREHHIQPVIHETEHRIQPIIKTQATTEQPIIEQDKNVMLPPVVERAALPAGLEAVERVAPEGVIHRPIVERQIVDERPVEVKREHHIQPIIHEREHRIQPIIKTEATTEQPIIEQDRNVMHAPIVERAALPAGLEAVERVAPEGVIHAPKVAKDVIVEHPVQIKHEHHVQPIIHEREHHIQPIIKTEVTAEQTHLRTDKNVMLAPVVERAALPMGLEAVERAGPEGVIHRAKLEKEVIVEHPVQVKHERHIQPIIHEREHHIQPVIKTEVTAEQTIIERENTVMLPPIIEPTVMVGTTTRAAPVMAQPVMAQPAVVATTTLPHSAGLDTAQPLAGATTATTLPRTAAVGGLDSEQRLASAGAVPPVLPGEREVYNRNLGATGTTATGGETHVGIGQKIKGAMKEVQGTITRNQAVKEEGRKLMHGETTTSTTGSRTGL